MLRYLYRGQTMRRLCLLIVVLSISSPALRAEQLRGRTIDESVPPGNNYDKAEFRLWFPQDAGVLRAAVVLVPGSNGDGRAEADDAAWQAFATKNRLALVG